MKRIVPYHCGKERPPMQTNGRRHKQRRGYWLKDAIDLVATTKKEAPVPGDVMNQLAENTRAWIFFR
jgi:hypothetical protein